MEKLICACVQLRSSDKLEDNIKTADRLVNQAADQGAQFIATPEMTGFMDIRSGGTRSKATSEALDACLAQLRQTARDRNIHVLIGSLAVSLEQDDRFANRSYLIGPTGEIIARYDKIHMFDVDVGDGQAYRESRSYKPGEQAVLAQTSIGAVGMTICYDLRFAYLYRMLAQAGASILTVPAAFTQTTGEAHWHVLLRARAIETGCYVIAPAQCGRHADGRETYGRSLIISPWGEILAEGGTDPGLVMAEIDLDEVAKARKRIPSLQHDRNVSLTKYSE